MRPGTCLAATALIAIAPACTPGGSTTQDGSADPQRIAALMTDDHTVHIDRPVAEVWAHVKSLYADGDRYAGYGNEIVDIGDDPTAYRGGYVAFQTLDDGERLERGVFRFSDIDDEKRFLAMSIVVPDPTVSGLVVTHHVTEAGNGSSYTVVIHANLLLGDETGLPSTQAEVAAEMEERIDAHHRGLRQIMEEVKAELEAGR